MKYVTSVFNASKVHLEHLDICFGAEKVHGKPSTGIAGDCQWYNWSENTEAAIMFTERY